MPSIESSALERWARLIHDPAMGSHRTFKAFENKYGMPAYMLMKDATIKPRDVRTWNEKDWLRWLLSDDYAAGMNAARELWSAIQKHQLRHVRRAREEGMNWDFIGYYSGVTKQTAHKRWAHRLKPRSVRYPADMSLDDLYREVILDHYRTPRNKRALDAATIDVHRNNPLCGDDITVHVQIQDGVAVDAAFEGVGCSISQASASMMTEQIKGKKVDELEPLVLRFRSMMAGESDPGEDELGDLVSLKGVVKYPVRIKCAVLAWDALQAGLDDGPA